MKIFILLAALLAPGSLMAQSEVCNSSWTVHTVSVSSFSATLVDSASLVLPERKWVEIQNISTDTVHCANVAAKATTTEGRILTANGGTWDLNFGSGNYITTMATTSPYASANTWTQNMRIYCITTATNVTGKVTISQCR